MAMVLSFVRIWVLVSWSAFYPLLLVKRGFQPAFVGTVPFTNGLVSTVVALTAGWFAKRLGRVGAVALALVIGEVGVAISPYVTVFPLLYLPAILVGITGGITLPLLIAIVGDSASSGNRGVAMGLRTSFNRVAVTVAPVVMGLLITGVGLSAGFACSAVLGWILVAPAGWLHRGRGRPE